MFKFLFGGKKNAPEVVIEKDRERYARLISELNEMIDGLAVKPKVTIDPSTGHIDLEAPEQFHDEALALPKPEEKAEQAADAVKEAAASTKSKAEAVVEAAKAEAAQATAPKS